MDYPTETQKLDAFILAMDLRQQQYKAKDLQKTLQQEVALEDEKRNEHAWFAAIAEAISLGVAPADVGAYLDGQIAESQKRLKASLDELDVFRAAYKKRYQELQDNDWRFSIVLHAIKKFQDDSIERVKKSETMGTLYVDHSIFVQAARDLNIDPAKLRAILPHRQTETVNSKIENMRRHIVAKMEPHIRSVFEDPLRRADKLPAWIKELIDSTPATRPEGEFIYPRELAKITKYIEEAYPASDFVQRDDIVVDYIGHRV